MGIQFGRFCGILLIFFCFSFQIVVAQDKLPSWTDTFNLFFSSEQTAKADSVLQKQIHSFIDAGEIDSLYQFPVYIGKIESTRKDANAAAKKAEDFISVLKTKTSNAGTIYKAYLSLDNLYVFLGDDQNAVVASKKALEYAQLLNDVTAEELGKINYAIGGNYYALYDLSEALGYFKNSAKAYERSKTAGKDKLADAYNGIAAAMWTLSKLDSAQIYYEKAIATTKESHLTGYDRTYYIVAFQFNLALVIDDQGHLSEALALKKEIITKLQEIIDGSEDEKLVKKSKRLQASAISNLAAFYHDIGYLTKAYEMLQYAYEKKQEVFESSSPRLATALLQIALSEYELQEFDNSLATTDKALKNLKESPSRYLSVEADIYALQAKVQAAKKNIEVAKVLYQKSHALYSEAYPKEYSREYLILLRDYAQFLAANNEAETSITIANKTYEYILKNGGTNSFPILKEILNLAEVYYKSGDFEKAFQWAQKGNNYLNAKLSEANSDIDSIQIEFRRPAITLMEVQSLYRTNIEKDSSFLKSQIQKLNKAVAFLERRKTTAFNVEDVNNILTEYKALNTVAKILHYDLYKLTKDAAYIDKTISLHESGIYNRIRTQFNIKNDIRFGNLPPSVLKREKALKNAISDALTTSSGKNIDSYFNANENWNSFLDSLKQKHPKYYSLRYATIEESLGDIQQKIPENTTVIRYLFIETDLYVFVMNRESRIMMPLNYEKVKGHIGQLGEDQSNVEKMSTLYFELYNQLWRSFEGLIKTDKIIIIPDRELFNLSFETLTPVKITSFNELAENSLLAKYIISYNYSLFLLKQPAPSLNYKENFVAFAPEFNDEMKKDYKISITDSLAIDKSYVTLLPQPFSVELVKKYANAFNGDYYLNERSTKQVFKANAKEHKIIHIGTHAESNNITPEFSRLIFAKDISGENLVEDNSIFTYEIYDYNLASNLTILTACETGKPTFEPGEGMISLAHAFNYAGSESMLTSLWKIDEQSSTKIIETFYENLLLGLPKDEALRLAKLSYISSAQGRTVSPQYWAGLVLIGDASPIELHTGFPFWPWFIGGIIALVLLFVVFKKRNTQS